MARAPPLGEDSVRWTDLCRVSGRRTWRWQHGRRCRAGAGSVLCPGPTGRRLQPRPFCSVADGAVSRLPRCASASAGLCRAPGPGTPAPAPPHPTLRLILRGRIRAHFACCFHTVIRGAWCLRVVQKSCTGLTPGPGEAAAVPVLCRPSPGLHWPLKPWFSECGLGRGPGPLRALGPFPGRRWVRLFHSNPKTLASRDRTAREFPEATRCVTAPRTNPRCRRPHQAAFVMLEVRFAEAMCITTPIFTNIFGKYCFSHKTIVRINVCQSPLPP